MATHIELILDTERGPSLSIRSTAGDRDRGLDWFGRCIDLLKSIQEDEVKRETAMKEEKEAAAVDRFHRAM